MANFHDFSRRSWTGDETVAHINAGSPRHCRASRSRRSVRPRSGRPSNLSQAKLTDWERSFIDSIERQLAQDRPLSQKQADTLDSIWERVT